MIKYNGLPLIPEGYELVPEAFEQRTGDGWMYCMSGDDEWSKCDSWWGVKENLIYIRPVVTTECKWGDMSNYRLLKHGEFIPGCAEYWSEERWSWQKSAAFVGHRHTNDPMDARSTLVYRVPIKKERPLLTPQDFIKDGPWWIHNSFLSPAYFMVTLIMPDSIMTSDGQRWGFEQLRRLARGTIVGIEVETQFKRSNDGVNWEDC